MSAELISVASPGLAGFFADYASSPYSGIESSKSQISDHPLDSWGRSSMCCMMSRLRRRQGLVFGKAIEKFLLVVNRKLIFLGHQQAMSRAWICTQVAVTAQRHVNVKLGDSQFDGGPIRSINRKFVFASLFGGHIYTVDGTSPDTLAAPDAVFNLVKQSHPRSLREVPLFTGIL
jgi:hypothetical protein